MGAWDIGSFDNDDALDWVYELEEAEDFSILAEAFETVLGQRGAVPDASDSSIVVCAAEVTAGLLDSRSDELPDEVLAWMEDQPEPSEALLKMASEALTIVLNKSELKELWAESDVYTEWEEGIRELLERMRPT